LARVSSSRVGLLTLPPTTSTSTRTSDMGFLSCFPVRVDVLR
jgi:hypothetical protein